MFFFMVIFFDVCMGCSFWDFSHPVFLKVGTLFSECVGAVEVFVFHVESLRDFRCVAICGL